MATSLGNEALLRKGPGSTLARIGLIGILLIGATGAFVAMGLFMFNMGRDMSTMTRSVVQMGIDVTTMAGKMVVMTERMHSMAESMAKGQSGMSKDLHQRPDIAGDSAMGGWREVDRDR
jgi:hypothetical protein